MLNLVKLAFVLTFIVSLGTNSFTNKLWWKHAGHENIRLINRLIRKAVRLEDSLFILAYISPVNNWLKHLQSQSSVGMFFNSLKQGDDSVLVPQYSTITDEWTWLNHRPQRINDYSDGTSILFEQRFQLRVAKSLNLLLSIGHLNCLFIKNLNLTK